MTEHKNKLNVFASEAFVIKISFGSKSYKIARIFFDVRGTVNVSTPYYQHSKGIIGEVTLSKNSARTTNVSLKEKGGATSHQVKLAFHIDGETHFSQDKKVRTVIRKKAEPLNQREGQLFAIMAHGLDHFQSGDGPRDQNRIDKKRSVIKFNFSDQMPEGIKLVGYWYKIKEMDGDVDANGSLGPWIIFPVGAGQRRPAVLLSQPLAQATGNVLVLTCEAIPPLNTNPTALSMIGGFDAPSITNDPSVDTTFLAFIYPSSDHEQLIKEVGSVDFIPS